MFTHSDEAHGPVFFCTLVCHEAWARQLRLPASRARAVSGGPPWCIHCRTCGTRCWTSPACPLCPECADGRWTLTLAATTFGAELGRHADPARLAQDAWDRGRHLCHDGLDPALAAHVILAQDPHA